MGTRSREIEYKFRLNKSEADYLNSKIEKAGCRTRRDFFLQLARNGKIINVNKILPELVRQGTNLNQIAKKINTCPEALATEELKRQLENTLKEVESIWQLLSQQLQNR